jgi:hypothetical protein
MSDDPIKLLRGDPPEDLAEPTDDEIEELLSLPSRVPREEIDAGKARFIKNIVEARRPEPVRNFGPGVSFGVWLKSARESLPLSQNMVSAAVGRSTYFVDSVEAAETPLWELEPEGVAALMYLFGVHVQAVEGVLRTERPKATRAGRPIRRDAPGYDWGAGQADMTALDFGRRGYSGPADWLEALRTLLRVWGADSLLD